MILGKTESVLTAVTDPLVKTLLSIAASILALMMFLTVMDVVGRYIFNMPIDGAFELVEFMMAIFVPFAYVYCQKEKSHIVVDLVYNRLPFVVQKILSVCTLLLTTLYFAVISWQSVLALEKEFSSKITSSVLLISTYPFFLPIIISFAVLTVLLLICFIRTFSNSNEC